MQSGLSWENVKWAFGFSADKSSSGIERSNWHPLTWISHMLACQIFGLKAWGHHLTNVLLHSATAVLVFTLLRGMTGAVWRSLAVALLFALHPLRAESVAWVAERKDVLSGFFWMLSLWFYVSYVKAQSSKAKVFYALSLLGFAGGLMSKTIFVTLPFVLLLLDFWPLQRWERKNVWPLLLEKIPFALLMVALSWVEFTAEKVFGYGETLSAHSLGVRVETAVVSYARYLGKMLWPVDLCGYYPHPATGRRASSWARELCWWRFPFWR